MSRDPALTAVGVTVRSVRGDDVVTDVAIEVAAGETLGIVGESGSGKTTMALALLGYAAPGLRLVAGELTVAGRDVDLTSRKAGKAVRGQLISYVPQNPGTALNPTLRAGEAVRETARSHLPERDSPELATEIFRRVGLGNLPGAPLAKRFPHELSGGQQQRLCIGNAIACEPPVVILDEPTTGLDVVTQARVLQQLRDLQKQSQAAMVYISHDLPVVASLAHAIGVMYAGRIVEIGRTADVLSQPKHPYTVGLLSATTLGGHLGLVSSIPGRQPPVGDRPPGCVFAPRCRLRVPDCQTTMPAPVDFGGAHFARCTQTPRISSEMTSRGSTKLDVRPDKLHDPRVVLSVRDLYAGHKTRWGTVTAASGVSFDVLAGSCVALVGESGSGKTTIARALAGLHTSSNGMVELEGQRVSGRAQDRTLSQLHQLQYVAQNPTETLNPRETVRTALERSLRRVKGRAARGGKDEVPSLLARVRLGVEYADRFPAELSGGERQRVAIARALTTGPSILICDEITSALDVSVQSAILDLLSSLQHESGLGILFITHDLRVVAQIASTVLVLRAGVICESGTPDRVLLKPETEYSRALVESALGLARIDDGGSADSAKPAASALSNAREI